MEEERLMKVGCELGVYSAFHLRASLFSSKVSVDIISREEWYKWKHSESGGEVNNLCGHLERK